RYSRNIAVTGIGDAGQEKLLAARVLVIGAGGLGSPVLLYLAAAGVGTLGIVDDDVVDLSNLQRQIIHTECGAGAPKTESARRAILSLNSMVTVNVRSERLTSENCSAILKDYDIVVDTTDNFTTKYLVADACKLQGIPHVWASVYQFYGQVSVFLADGKQPCYRCLYPEPTPAHLAPNCADGGVLGAVCATLASVQASETIKLITGVGELLAGRVLTWDAASARAQEFQFDRDPGCALCGDTPIIEELTEVPYACSAERVAEGVREVTVAELDEMLSAQGTEKPLLLDVRTSPEWDSGVIAGATHFPLPLTVDAQAVDRLPRDRVIVAYCKGGVRSKAAAGNLQRFGISALSLIGGIEEWSQTHEITPTLLEGSPA
ncbi:MAG: ThiF family adenylyltransferase, partial [Arthrobacter sp.]|nr:ThiF family adenylyltransferase [Arthrobacter sp.]